MEVGAETGAETGAEPGGLAGVRVVEVLGGGKTGVAVGPLFVMVLGVERLEFGEMGAVVGGTGLRLEPEMEETGLGGCGEEAVGGAGMTKELDDVGDVGELLVAWVGGARGDTGVGSVVVADGQRATVTAVAARAVPAPAVAMARIRRRRAARRRIFWKLPGGGGRIE